MILQRSINYRYRLTYLTAQREKNHIDQPGPKFHLERIIDHQEMRSNTEKGQFEIEACSAIAKSSEWAKFLADFNTSFSNTRVEISWDQRRYLGEAILI